MKYKKQVKLFFMIMLTLFVYEFVTGMLSTSGGVSDIQHLLSFLVSLSSYPLKLVDRSYPFYAEGSLFFVTSLVLINLILQTFFIYYLIRIYQRKYSMD